MLVITRRIGECVIIADNIGIKILGIRGNQIRLGINAPLSINVDREELYQRKKTEKTHHNQKKISVATNY